MYKYASISLLQANVMYNVKKVTTKPKFAVSVQIFSANEKLSRRRSCRAQTLKVCTTYIGKEKESNMAIIDVKMISGFTADVEQFDEVIYIPFLFPIKAIRGHLT